MLAIDFEPDARNEIPAGQRNDSDLSGEGEVYLRYHYFSCWVSFSVDGTVLLDRSYVPLLDFMLSLNYAIRELRVEGVSFVTFTEHSGKIGLLLRDDNIYLTSMDGIESVHPFEDFARTSFDFIRSGTTYLLSKYPSLGANSAVQGLPASIDEW